MLDGRNKENAGNCSGSGSGSENNAEKRIKKLEEEEALRRDGFEVTNAEHAYLKARGKFNQTILCLLIYFNNSTFTSSLSSLTT